MKDAFKAGEILRTWSDARRGSRSPRPPELVRTLRTNGLEASFESCSCPEHCVREFETSTTAGPFYRWLQLGFALESLRVVSAPSAGLFDSAWVTFAQSSLRKMGFSARSYADLDALFSEFENCMFLEKQSRAGSIYHYVNQLLDGMTDPISKTGDNITVTLTNVTIHAPVAIGKNIQQTWKQASEVSDDVLQKALKDVTEKTTQLIAEIPDKDKQVEVSEDLKKFVEESAKANPNRRWFECSATGLYDAAKAVASLTEPVTKAVKAVVDIITDSVNQ